MFTNLFSDITRLAEVHGDKGSIYFQSKMLAWKHGKIIVEEKTRAHKHKREILFDDQPEIKIKEIFPDYVEKKDGNNSMNNMSTVFFGIYQNRRLDVNSIYSKDGRYHYYISFYDKSSRDIIYILIDKNLVVEMITTYIDLIKYIKIDISKLKFNGGSIYVDLHTEQIVEDDRFYNLKYFTYYWGEFSEYIKSKLNCEYQDYTYESKGNCDTVTLTDVKLKNNKVFRNLNEFELLLFAFNDAFQ